MYTTARVLGLVAFLLACGPIDQARIVVYSASTIFDSLWLCILMCTVSGGRCTGHEKICNLRLLFSPGLSVDVLTFSPVCFTIN